MEKIRTHRELRVYQLSFEAGMEIFKISPVKSCFQRGHFVAFNRASKFFPKEEMYSLTDQIRRSSRSVSGNLTEAFRKRRYPKAFVSKLSDAESEAAETQVWLDYALECEYLDSEAHAALNDKYDHIISMIVNMCNKPENWSW